MDSLPSELLARIAFFLPCTTDLRTLRLVNKRLAAETSRPLFELLRFSGRRQDEPPVWNFGPTEERELPTGHVGRIRTVEFSKIPKVVDEIIDSPVVCHTKTLVFDPAYYREKFWRDYLMQLENQMHEPVDEVEVEFDPGDETDGTDWEAAIERVLQRRRTRPARETKIINAAQVTWNSKIADQKQNEEAIAAALTRLFRVMEPLERIDIRAWEFNGTLLFPGLETCISYEIDVPRRGSFPSTFFLEVLARALHAANRRIRILRVNEFFVEHLHDSPAIRHMFTGLQHISLNIIHVEFLAEQSRNCDLLIELFKCAQPTLRHLSIMAGGKWPGLPARGAHSLLKMIGDGTDETGGKPLIFPHLEFIRLGGIILSTPPLVQFFCAQPSLKRLEFSHLYLSTNGSGWPSVIETLPPTVESWKVRGPLGHEPQESPFDEDAPTAYNWMETWTPREQSALPGWKAISGVNETCFTRLL
ncbi:hypothetical protein F5Y08DRAFT_311280 [Xylaria arbuscula]|nr:hypothetical protein F5Y08DRAFT_311280 [Xylaria arbuscula]